MRNAMKSSSNIRSVVAASLSVVTLLGLAQLTGCSSNKALPASKAPAPQLVDPTLGAGDELELKFYYAPELNVTQRIRADGKLSLQLVGEVTAAGKSPSELETELREQYAKHLKFPDVTVIVRNSFSRRIFVGGEVVRTGVVDMPSDVSLLEGVMLAGGFSMTSADVGQVIVMRYEGEKRVGYSVNMQDELKGAAVKPFMLQPGDIIYVPRTPIVEINQFMTQYIAGVVPGGFTVQQRFGNNTSAGIDTSGRR
jgi:polysaccharide biosynthesis/export protein